MTLSKNLALNFSKKVQFRVVKNCDINFYVFNAFLWAIPVRYKIKEPKAHKSTAMAPLSLINTEFLAHGLAKTYPDFLAYSRLSIMNQINMKFCVSKEKIYQLALHPVLYLQNESLVYVSEYSTNDKTSPKTLK